MARPFYTFLREAPAYALVIAAALLGAAGALMLWLGIDEPTRVVVRIGAVLAGMGLAAVVLATLRGLAALSRGIGRRYRARQNVWQPVLIVVSVLVALVGALAVHNYVTWRGIERDCNLALKTADLVEGERLLRRARGAMDQRLLLLPSSLFDLWGPNRCRSASRRYPRFSR